MAKKHIDRAALIAAVRELKELSNEQKADILQLISEQKKYGLVWEDSPEEAEDVLRTNIPVLKEVKDKAILSPLQLEGAGEAPNHILIEGENLQALNALVYLLEGMVDVIYIDPPYNTGNKDFVYNDSFVDSEDGYRHSKWLSFMEKRLRIAKKLLSDKGVIFISIDDNEQANLKLLCDSIFGEQNCLASLIWDLGSGTSAGHFTRAHEYVLVYCVKRYMIPNFSGGEGIIDDRAIKKKSIKNAESEYKFQAGTKFEAEDGFELSGEWGDAEKTRLISGRFLCENGKLKENVVLSACWTQRNQMDSFFSNKETFDSKGQKVIEFYFRDNGKLYCRKRRDKINPPTVLRELASTKQGTSKLKEIFDDNLPFDFAKPLNLIEFLLRLRDKDSLILDFFAGSGTTLHATMQLNAEDGGHRQCILVTNNENNICEEVTYERNKRVIEGYTTPKGVKVEGLHNNNLRYYKMDFVPRENTAPNRMALMEAATDMLCIKEGCYTELRNLGRLELRKKYVRYFAESKTEDGKAQGKPVRQAQGKQMLIIYEPEAVQYIAKELREDKTIATKEHPLHIFVYSDGGYAYQDEFEGLLDVVELTAMPDALMQSLRNVLPEQNIDDETFDTEEGGQDND